MPGVHLTDRRFEDLPEEAVDVASSVSPEWLKGTRWFQHKHADIGGISVRDCATVASAGAPPWHCIFLVLEVCPAQRTGAGKDADLYNVPLIVCDARDAGMVGDIAGANALAAHPLVVIRGPGYDARVYDATLATPFARAVLEAAMRESRIAASLGSFEFHAVRPGSTSPGKVRTATRLPDTSTNTLIVIDSSHVVKVYRRMVAGASVDLEMSVRLTQAGFRHIPHVTGYATYRAREGRQYPLMLIQRYVPNVGDGWEMAVADAEAWLGSVRTGGAGREYGPCEERRREARLGAVTAELHHASAGIDDDAFRPEDLCRSDVMSLGSEVASSIDETVRALRRAEAGHDPALACRIREVVSCEPALAAAIDGARRALVDAPCLGKKLRIHGDLHLGQFLGTEREGVRDFVVTDFEGEPLRAADERRRKSSPLRDVAGVLRSFDYAAYSAALGLRGSDGRRSAGRGRAGCRRRDQAVHAAKRWARGSGEAFLSGYLGEIGARGSSLLPRERRHARLLLACFKLEKALYEVRYELANRPGWLEIPLAGVLDSLRELEELVASPA